jgi:hypothetical protein
MATRMLEALRAAYSELPLYACASTSQLDAGWRLPVPVSERRDVAAWFPEPGRPGRDRARQSDRRYSAAHFAALPAPGLAFDLRSNGTPARRNPLPPARRAPVTPGIGYHRRGRCTIACSQRKAGSSMQFASIDSKPSASKWADHRSRSPRRRANCYCAGAEANVAAIDGEARTRLR